MGKTEFRQDHLDDSESHEAQPQSFEMDLDAMIQGEGSSSARHRDQRKLLHAVMEFQAFIQVARHPHLQAEQSLRLETEVIMSYSKWQACFLRTQETAESA